MSTVLIEKSMISSLRTISPQKVLSCRKRKSITDNTKLPPHKRKSLLLQHSISLHIPIDELSKCGGLNCYVNLPEQIFRLSYLEANETQNPESLQCLEGFKKGKWQVYLVGFLYNFNYQPAQLKSLAKALNSTLRTKFQNSKDKMTYHSQVSVVDTISPTENDSEALNITVIGRADGEEKLLYNGYLMSWYNPMKESRPLLPILLCQGKTNYQILVHTVLSEMFDVMINRLTLAQEDFVHLTTYCIVMLDENDGYVASSSYKIPTGVIKLDVHVEHLLRLWRKIHKDDSIDIELDEINCFHEALENFYESVFGIKLAYAQFQNITVSKCFSLHINSQMWFRSTKIIHVVLKYLNYLAIQRLKVKALNSYFDEGHINISELNVSMC